jgi:hypothetical protein
MQVDAGDRPSVSSSFQRAAHPDKGRGRLRGSNDIRGYERDQEGMNLDPAFGVDVLAEAITRLHSGDPAS